jgi:hypothetical protein
MQKQLPELLRTCPRRHLVNTNFSMVRSSSDRCQILWKCDFLSPLFKLLHRQCIFLLRDVFNRIKYRGRAPLAAQCIEVNPKKVRFVLRKLMPRHMSGKVMDGDWDLHKRKIKHHPKFKYCLARFVEGVDWERAGAYAHMKRLIAKNKTHDECSSLDDIVERYKRLDSLFEEAKAEQKLKTQKELRKFAFREYRGIYIHIDRNGDPLFGKGGWHRLMIAKILGLKAIPAQIGIVHKQSLDLLQ